MVSLSFTKRKRSALRYKTTQKILDFNRQLSNLNFLVFYAILATVFYAV